MYSKELESLINTLIKIPGVGPRTAARFAFFLANTDDNYRKQLSSSITNLETLKRCPSCFKLFNKEQKLCSICSDKTRQKDKLCVVEKEIDLESIEKSHSYKGLYFVLGGTVSDLRQEDLKKLRIKELQERIKDNEIKEVILALNPTVEGDSTRLYLSRKLKGKKITSLGRGLPTGGEVEYADSETLFSAFQNRA